MKRRGSALVLALLVASLLLVVGTANLFEHRARYKARSAAGLAVQAEALAWAGLEDCRLKLERDQNFPPRDDQAQTLFSYTETVVYGGDTVGAYQVTCDSSLTGRPWKLLLVTSVGWAGAPGEPRVQRVIKGEFDLSTSEFGTANDNPRAYYFRMQDNSWP